MKGVLRKMWRWILKKLTGPDLDWEKFQELESKKVIRKGVRFYGHD